MPERERGRIALRLDAPGSIVAAVFFCLSLTPSLLPRSWLIQGIIAGVVTAAGYLTGVILGTALRRSIAWRPRPERRRAIRWVITALVAGMCTASLIAGARDQRHIYALMDLAPPERLGYLGVPVVAAAVFLVFLLTARVLRIAARALSGLLVRWVPALVAEIAAALCVAVLVFSLAEGVLAESLLDAADTSFAAINQETTPGTTPPRSATLSGGPSSLVSWESLGRQGRDFVAGAPGLEELRRFNGRTPVEPIRVYVGLDSAATLRERAALAVRELERTGAFSRKVLCVITTTGTGWVDPQAAAALEFMYNGDTALVAMQYSYLPSWLSFLVDRDRAQAAGRELFQQVYERWSRLPREHRPKLLVFGESLGAFGAESAFTGDQDLRDRTDGALFVGPPDSSVLRRRFVHGRDPGSTEVLPIYRKGETVRFANRPADLAEPSAPWDPPRVVYLQHPSDPIVWWSPRLLFEKPDWLSEPRGADVLPHIRWYPIVTFSQITADLAFALDVPPGHGHNYDGEVVAAWARIAAPEGWTDERTAELTALIQRAHPIGKRYAVGPTAVPTPRP
ncbi:MAG: alpha/beta-hydrolase family protein [Thermobispora sp.]|nr:alpha/beta-hydrolase family protein [Thermobispora sp.]